MFQTIGMIGVGTMGSAVAQAIAKGDGNAKLLLSNRTHKKAVTLAEELGATATTNQEVARHADIIFLAVKPQTMPDVLHEISPILRLREGRFILVSMAAGLMLDRLRGLAGGHYPMIRIMPNTPAAIGQGITVFCGDGITDEEKADFLTIMEPSGIMYEMKEDMITAANCVTACGVAFAAMFLEALSDGGVACGMPREQALVCAAQTMLGTSALYLGTRQHPGELKDAVCSPGGTSIQGVRLLESRGFRAAAMEAVIASYEKTVDLGKK